MASIQEFPEIAFVRVLTAGGPYAAGATISLAFTQPGAARLAAHDGTTIDAPSFDGALIPETISTRVVRPAGPYKLGDVLALSFVDPSMARIHVATPPDDRGTPTHDRRASDIAQAQATQAQRAPDSAAPAPMAATPSVSQDFAMDAVADPQRVDLELTADPSANAVPLRAGDDPDRRTEQAFRNSLSPAAAVPPAPSSHAPRPAISYDFKVSDSLPVAPAERSASASPAPARSAAPTENVEIEREIFGDVKPVAKVESSIDGGAELTEGPVVTGRPADARTGVTTIAPGTVAEIVRSTTGQTPSAPARPIEHHGVRVRLDWNRDRVRRFVQVVDKLFTIDRIGWYRHVFAMRLLVPDVVLCGKADTDVEALRHLHALRATSIETLGKPLLAAFMPNFGVTPEWLDSLDKPGAARALSGLREVLAPLATDEALTPDELEFGWTISTIGRKELGTASASSVESLLPLFIPAVSPIDDLTEKLGAYRAALIDIFGQTAHSAEAVRLNLMAQPNHTLDDRLEQLAHAVNAAFGGLAVA